MSTIFVTGGVGFLGSHICRALVHAGHFVISIDDYSGSDITNVLDLLDHSQFISIKEDCGNDKAMLSLFEHYKPQFVYHLAANARESASFFQPMSIVRRNVLAYTNVITAAIKHRAQRIIVFSSIAAYGHQEPPFAEFMPLQPVDLYGLSKKYMEDMTVMLAGSHHIEYVIFRPHNVIGIGQSLSDPFRNVVTIWMNKIMRGEPLIIYGDGSQQRAFSYIDNSVPCYLKGMECRSGEIFNIGSDQAWSVKSMAQLVLEMMDAAPDYPLEYLPQRHGEVKIAYSDHSKARRILGLKEEISVVEGVRRMARWAKSMGPQEWRTGDPLEIFCDLVPPNWR